MSELKYLIAKSSRGSDLAQQEKYRRKRTAASVGWGTGAIASGGAGVALTSAKWAPPETHAVTAGKINRAVRVVRNSARGMGRQNVDGSGKPTLTFRALNTKVGRDLGGTYVRAAKLARKYPGRSTTAALGLKGAGVVAGAKSFHERAESTGLSHDIAERRAKGKAK